MSTTQQLELVIKAKPGMSTREVAAAIGVTDGKGVSRVSALLCQSTDRGKLRRELRLGTLHYFPTEKSGQDQRAAKPRPPRRRDPAKTTRAAATRKPTVERTTRQKPSAEQVASVSALFAKRTPRLKTLTGEETVDEFIQRGGVIQRLPPGACRRPLASFTADDDFLPL